MVVLLISHIIFSEVLLIGRFEKEYEYFKLIYKMYMPDAIIYKEKRIKFWLVMNGVLKK